MGLNVRIYDIVSDGPYSIRYKSGANPYPEYDNTTFTLYGTGLTATTIELTGLTFDTQYWIKMTDETTGRYIVKNIYTHDSKAFPCYDTICFSVDVECNVEPVATNTPTPTPTVTSTSTPTLTSTPTPTMSCQVPVIESVVLLSGTTFEVTFIAGPNCSATQIEYSNDNVNWTANAAGCTSPRQVDPGSSSGTWYFRMKQFCLNSTSSVYSSTVSVSSSTATPTPTPTLTRTPTPTLTRTPTPTLTRTPTPTGTCAYKQWTIGQCTIGTCNLGICQCQGTTALTVYTQCSVTDLLDEGTAIYSTSSLISPFTGDFTYQAGSNPYIYNSSGSGVTLVCSLGNGC